MTGTKPLQVHLAASQRIKTYSESAESEAIKTAKAWMDAADTQIYLGFGFHEQNMKLLSPDHAHMAGDLSNFRFKAYATTHSLSKSDEEVVKDQISYLRTGASYDSVHPWIHTNQGTCADLFRSYWRSLTN